MDYDALDKSLRFALRDWKGREDRYHFPSINALTISEAADAIADLRARNDALVEANGVLEDALQEVGDDYPGSSCQQWCQQQVKRAREIVSANREK